MKLLRITGRILSIALTAVLALLLACNLYTIAARYFGGVQQPAVFGYSVAVVISGSMSGSIEVNDMVVIHEEDSYALGDVVTFRSGKNLVTHRIVGTAEGGFITKGDANNASDLDPVPPEDIVGKVIWVIPKIGAMIEFIRTPLGMTALVLIGFALIELPIVFRRKGDTANEE